MNLLYDRDGEVPPLARRCACALVQAIPMLAGSSARAEMRRILRGRAWCAPRFLRSRGDAPHHPIMRMANALVPPLARRCADACISSIIFCVGSSARAEMRRLMSVVASKVRWFLRSRGDAPGLQCAREIAPRVPPLARRCASGSRLLTRSTTGSSARAEMRLCGGPALGCLQRFLRSRGDAPDATHLPNTAIGVPPLARRCAR